MADKTDYYDLASAARRLGGTPDVEATLRAITQAAVATVPGADCAGISWVERRRVTAQAPTHELVAYCDQLQTKLGEGPCLQAIRSQDTVVVEDLTVDQRWPEFAAHAVERGVRSMLSFRLFVARETLGALNLYSCSPGRFGENARIVGELFAAHAAVVVSGKRREDQLSQALLTRDVIGQAKGILMERYGITAEQAFDRLIAASQAANMKLREVAAKLASREGPDLTA
ncbi:GAF domain-containing protein [Saccharopolyspora erythraea NRRL 2338]|uniref:Response regulator receiver and ANTAR domain protein n=2 Tax=Saccharopolyspora erythraea TaxID=1836 RepID=A4FDC6_SACEN|nr:GAF and ANTAR domain-containing protein [Saccharopolyspora erythraea]EQD84852.1 response regulator receiver [Saccharopolyspora erythraea D]PFG95794.1 GAF domain-containing protein [Saccharopolyspora erythraea NRRL 2338]QRK92381.1 GAF and ANTAR domain-containing protein [Saccharopolyspora erythraea]CAM02051.1 response regulator receiver and ANTAR domain protein [Saccharopolyspora erythraea NRRL 2338]